MKEQRKNYYPNKDYSYFNSSEKYLNFYSLNDSYLTLSFDDIILNNYNYINVYLKNIKTREILKCVSRINNNNLIIDLKNLSNYCTDYEFSLIIILEDEMCSTAIYPKIKNLNTLEKSIISASDNMNIQWYLRFLENGKLRLSTIYLFSSFNSDTIEKIIL